MTRRLARKLVPLMMTMASTWEVWCSQNRTACRNFRAPPLGQDSRGIRISVTDISNCSPPKCPFFRGANLASRDGGAKLASTLLQRIVDHHLFFSLLPIFRSASPPLSSSPCLSYCHIRSWTLGSALSRGAHLQVSNLKSFFLFV